MGVEKLESLCWKVLWRVSRPWGKRLRKVSSHILVTTGTKVLLITTYIYLKGMTEMMKWQMQQQRPKPHAAVYGIRIEFQEKLLHHKCGVALWLRRTRISIPAGFQDALKQRHDWPGVHGSSYSKRKARLDDIQRSFLTNMILQNQMFYYYLGRGTL